MRISVKTISSAAVVTLCLLSPAHAAEERYISIRNTDTVWVPGNICAYHFTLDNGGNGEGFGPLTLSLRLKNKSGKTLATGKMDVDAFGDSDATRTQSAMLEQECVDDVSNVEIIKATELRNGKPVNLALSVFDPQYYQPLKISVAGKP